MKRTPRPRKTADLSDSLHRQLSMYTLVASAAGVGLLTLGQSSEAKIIYTPVHHVIRDHGGHYNLDLNNDGKIDFVLGNTTSCGTDLCDFLLWVDKARLGNSIIASQTNGGWNLASAIKKGARIGPGGKFNAQVAVLAGAVNLSSSLGFGPWLNIKNRYLGLRFVVRGKTHYGWARLNVKANASVITGTLTGYAYETIPDKSIIAGATEEPDQDQLAPASFNSRTPESATLGALALGAPGLSIWRREECLAAIPERN
jgi:hypothetical protein